MIRGHIDDLVLVPRGKSVNISPDPVYPDDYVERDFFTLEARPPVMNILEDEAEQHLILYDYKTAHSKWFEYAKKKPVSYYNKMQVGTYMYMLRKFQELEEKPPNTKPYNWNGFDNLPPITEARILKISKDDLRLFEYQVLWTDGLLNEVMFYWRKLNKAWGMYQKTGHLPGCTCAEHENGFLAKEAYNPYFYADKPCSEEYFKLKMAERK
jgi:hypothetical protein